MKTRRPKKKPLTKAYFRRKADALLQNLGREVYDKCMACGKPMACLHHYYPKSSAGNLRYYWPNLIPLCQGCHFSHHNGNPEIHNTVNRIKGEEWLDGLKDERRRFAKCDTIGYYLSIIDKLENGGIENG